MDVLSADISVNEHQNGEPEMLIPVNPIKNTDFLPHDIISCFHVYLNV